jgi:hypothetical protein
MAIRWPILCNVPEKLGLKEVCLEFWSGILAPNPFQTSSRSRVPQHGLPNWIDWARDI